MGSLGWEFLSCDTNRPCVCHPDEAWWVMTEDKELTLLVRSSEVSYRSPRVLCFQSVPAMGWMTLSVIHTLSYDSNDDWYIEAPIPNRIDPAVGSYWEKLLWGKEGGASYKSAARPAEVSDTKVCLGLALRVWTPPHTDTLSGCLVAAGGIHHVVCPSIEIPTEVSNEKRALYYTFQGNLKKKN